MTLNMETKSVNKIKPTKTKKSKKSKKKKKLLEQKDFELNSLEYEEALKIMEKESEEAKSLMRKNEYFVK